MSSVKRRKVDGDVPSGMLKKKEHAAKEQALVSASTSPGPEAPEEPQDENVEEATKTFKDLVCTLKVNVGSK
jgi:ATP-dependent RNA helicase DDX47/RRP3